MSGRPAETGGVVAAVVGLLVYFLSIDDPGVIAAMMVVVGFIPAAITWAVVTFRKPKTDVTTFGPRSKKIDVK